MVQVLINAPMSDYSSKHNISLALPRLSAEAGNCSSCSIHIHGIKGEIPQGGSWEIIHWEDIRKADSWVHQVQGSARQQYWLTPFYTTDPFYTAFFLSTLFLPAPPSSAHSLSTRYNPTKPFQHPRHSVACILISCELPLSKSVTLTDQVCFWLLSFLIPVG